MKRTIELYIDGHRADLDTNGLILMNYALTDLEKPTAVKNSYSKQVTLPGTPANAQIFNHIARADRRTSTGFNAGKKAPFAAFNNEGEKVLCGYLRLDSVTRAGQIVTGYKVTLFGGIGSFFYSLSYDENGNKKSLADLDYKGTGLDSELDFTINATNVKAAWTRLRNYPDSLANTWDYINFAPAYNGAPDGNFDATKGIVGAASVGLPTSVVDGSDTYVTNSGNTLVNLPVGVDEWAAKDLRSYLQRPVLSMKGFLAAIARPVNNGGYEVDYSGLNTRYKRIWKTLPMLPSLGELNQTEGSSIAYAQPLVAYHSNQDPYTFNVYRSGAAIPSGAECTFEGSFSFKFAASASGALSFHAGKQWASSNRNWYLKDTIIFAQLVAYGSDNSIVGGSPVKVLSSINRESVATWVESCGYTPPFAGAGYDTALTALGDLTLTDGYYKTDAFTFQVKANDINKLLLHITAYKIESASWVIRGSGTREQHYWELRSVSGGTDACPVLYASYDSQYQTTTATGVKETAGTFYIYYTTPSDIRSGAKITKRLLLSTEHTPAEYLISFCKQFGLMMLCDEARKKITILSRNAFYDTGLAPIDLTKRVDRGRDITLVPLAMKSKWYTMKNDVAEGAYAKEYKDIYGVDYGIQRINTGYDFDASDINLVDGSVFKGAATILQHNKYWVRIYVGSQFRPSPFLDSGVTHTLWNQSTGAEKTFPVPGIPTSATLYMYNIAHDYYDMDAGPLRLDLADKDNKPVDGADILVYYRGAQSYNDFKVSDDTAGMVTLAGKPCWDLSPGTSALSIPNFSRYAQGDGADEYDIDRTLDFGIPREVNIPDCHFNSNASIYNRYWKKYLGDLLDKDTKVMKCRVDFSGIQVNQELLRRFFYYDGCLWVLNKINNYSLTTWDPAECEFVQVQNILNYTEGQIFVDD